MTNPIAYKGCGIWRSSAMTSIGNQYRYLYSINGRHSKPAEKRPFLTSIKSAKEWITGMDDKVQIIGRISEHTP
jgi:hypothetical protein